MLDERLGRHSVVVASLGLIPGLLVIAWLADGIVANPGASHSPRTHLGTFRNPATGGIVLGLLNGYHLLRAVALAAAALVMIGVWYAVLIVPAAALCTATHSGSCM